MPPNVRKLYEVVPEMPLQYYYYNVSQPNQDVSNSVLR